ncbi:thiamine pyrophosphate-dependent dehydrogenase E1 component subunit alpha [Mycolicibacterium moriokaense]|uniref:Acetoin:2,6-dichlorophenolindophenol oxidoreductase subunit alpha n=1 Tax=Mycolicibacterium moriokaense TaxID=39691 RepID=A0AAD1HI93_9MYCO|nr:thiamine pyrophosphate-dependent dehydrogenase E1 component subunit alpha [Mycolicibacterium moriokaense]BBX04716.1 acetoin:2,6-dichlorophenolindophenol oxidoreductase subunit alpha [Mycolicibacterium moriokaense]
MATYTQASMDGPSTDMPSREQLLQMYLTMRTITTADERISAEARAGTLQATFYPVRGLEGVCAALGITLDCNDFLVSTYRNLGDAVAKGTELRRIIAEEYGRATGVSQGKGGPMHLHDVSVGFMATTGIVGAGLPIAVGLGLATQLDGGRHATAVTFGDGATSIGAFHEAMNLAALWELPIVFVCQNNQWAEHTALSDYAANTDLAARAAAYGMRSTSVDGFDPITTWRTLRTAVTVARAGLGPTFVECRTYRLAGHTGATDYSYMPAAELDSALKRDPAPSFRRWLQSAGIFDAAELDDLDRRAQETVDDAFQFALDSEPPQREQLLQDVFAPERNAS